MSETQIYNDDPSTDGAMYTPIILGSDKTTVSVATGNVEYHPLYISIGNIHNSVRRAHRNGVTPIAFLAIPKSDRKYDNDPAFRAFKRNLYHQSIAAILSPLKPAMLKPVVRRCPDGHFRRVIYDLAAFIADYPEQVLLCGLVQGWCPKCTAFAADLDGEAVRRTAHLTQMLRDEFGGEGMTLWDNYGIDEDITPFTEEFPRADIYEMISPDLLHQIIKGTFKDHLVTWVGDYLTITHGEARANEIMDDIDRRIACAPPFPALRRFPHGRRFKQWTGDDSKALMKVYVSAIADYVPPEITKTFAAFLDFCYAVRRNDFDEAAIDAVSTTLDRFRLHREVFRTSGVREDFSLPRQHAGKHYPYHIEEFGAPNGLCSSITESRHITAVKKPWRRSNRYNALSQMLLTNQRLDKIAALRADLVDRDLLPPTHGPLPLPTAAGIQDTDESEAEDDGVVDDDHPLAEVSLARTRQRLYPRDLDALAGYTEEPLLPELLRRFLFDQLQPANSPLTSNDVELDNCPVINSKVYVHHSAVAVFYAPSDLSGLHGFRTERIRCTPSWHGMPRRDCALVVEDEDKPGFLGMRVVRVKLFMSFTHNGVKYPCALVEWFRRRGRYPDAHTGMWIVEPEYKYGRREVSVLHVDTFLRNAHLLPVFGSRPVPVGIAPEYSLDIFRAFYVNKYADHHMNELLS